MSLLQSRNIINDFSSLFNDLVETKICLKKLNSEQHKVAGHFEAWRNHRKLTIETVDGLQKKLDALCVGCNAARVVGATAGVVGVLAWTVGTVLKWKGYESAAKLIQTSKYCAGASSVTVASSSLLEMGLTQKSLNDIKRVIEKDMELTKPLQNWIKFSHQVKILFKRLFGCSILSATFSLVMKVVGHCIELLDAGQTELNDLVRDLECCEMRGVEDLALEASKKVLYFLKKVQRNPKLLQPMREISDIFKDTAHVFQFATLGAAVYCKVFQFVNSGSFSAVLSLVNIQSPGLNSECNCCLLNMAAFASHVVTIIISVKNIQEGKSKYSKALDEMKSALRSELDEVTKQITVHSFNMDLN